MESDGIGQRLIRDSGVRRFASAPDPTGHQKGGTPHNKAYDPAN